MLFFKKFFKEITVSQFDYEIWTALIRIKNNFKNKLLYNKKN